MSAAAEHPAPHRDRAGPGVLLTGMTAAPAAWILQLTVAYGLSSFTCAPHGVPRQPGPLDWPEQGMLLGFNLVCLALAVIGGLIALRSWRRTAHEITGDGHSLLQTGAGRTRFLAACGILSATGFVIAILFNTAEFFTVPVCWASQS